MRQGVVDYLVAKGFPMSAMKVEVTAVQFKGDEAQADVTITPAGGGQGMAMQRQYQLKQQGVKWVVTQSQEAGGNPHGGGMMPNAQPGMANPHGGGGMAAPAAGAGGMPSPQDLPPVDKKKQ